MPGAATKHITTKATVTADGEEQGLLEAVFSVFDTIDSDGDVVLRSAFRQGQAVPMVWSHDWTKPIGDGKISVQQDRAVFKGRLWLDTDDGLQAFRRIRNAGELQEYSWGFQVTDAEPGLKDGQQVRFIKGTELFEVSPVLVGANRQTQTLALKGQCPTCAEKADPDPADDDLEEKPYGIRRRGEEFCVYNTETGATVPGGCHPTRAEALRHQRALMVNVPDAGKDGEPEARLAAALDAVLAGVKDAPPTAAPERAALAATLERLDAARHAIERALKATELGAELDPRNLLARFHQFEARYGDVIGKGAG